MPELPEVQLVVNSLNEVLAGKRITFVDLIWPDYLKGIAGADNTAMLTGQTFGSISRRGKFILMRTDSLGLILHLRMTGKTLIMNHDEELPKHTHLVFGFEDFKLAFNDVRKFGRLVIVPLEDLQKAVENLNLGLEPLEQEFDSNALSDIVKGRNKCIKNVLLDQSLIAGIGNIYAVEILFASGVSPFCSAGEIKRKKIQLLVENTKSILKKAIENGGSSIRDYVGVNGQSGNMQNNFRVYGRTGEECIVCGTTIERKSHAGRSTFWCPECQKN
jgi:formamidopyrimidine-DNA glycosylase